MPLQFRLDRIKRILGPAPCWFIKQEVVGKVDLVVDVTIQKAEVQNGRVVLTLTDSTTKQKTLIVDHVMAATGYQVDLRRLKFLDSGLLTAIRTVENTPILSSNFESTVPVCILSERRRQTRLGLCCVLRLGENLLQVGSLDI